jgi:hypothetical protein
MSHDAQDTPKKDRPGYVPRKKRVSDHNSEAARAARKLSRVDQAEGSSLALSASLRDLDPSDLHVFPSILEPYSSKS